MTAREAEVERVDVTRRALFMVLHPTFQNASLSTFTLQLPYNVALTADAAACGAGAQQKHGAAQVQHVGCGACISGPLSIARVTF